MFSSTVMSCCCVVIFFVQVSLTFVVYDWDGPLVGDDLLGVAKLNILQVSHVTSYDNHMTVISHDIT